MVTRRLRQGIVALMLAVGAVQVHPAPAQNNWPTDGWTESSPEAQGMNSDELAAMLAFIDDESLPIDGIVVVRGGAIVAEAYVFPYRQSTQHRLYSVTKSVTSAVTGIALDQGLLDGLDETMLSFFPGRSVDHLDDAKRAIVLEDLLTMRSGLEWDDGMTLTYELASQPDWIEFVLDRPMEAEPGREFHYHNGVPVVIAAIVQQVAGVPMADYAQTMLFDPLGIEPDDTTWEPASQGITNGSWGLFMTPRDMAKFGYLYLNEGQWDGQQIVPATWVETSTQPQLSLGTGEGYGYLWWTHPGYYAAQGLFGQYIIVVPEDGLVVVFTSNLQTGADWPLRLLEQYILPAVQSDDALPADPDGAARLAAAAEALAEP